MKKRKLFMLLLAILTITICTIALAACDTPNAEGVIDCVVWVGDAKYEVNDYDTANGSSLADVLNHLKNTQDLHLVVSEGAYGSFITAIGTLIPSEKQYVGVFTSIISNFDVSAYVETITKGGVSMSTAGLGISQLSIANGATFAFIITVYE